MELLNARARELQELIRNLYRSAKSTYVDRESAKTFQHLQDEGLCSKKNSQSKWLNVKLNNMVCVVFPPANTDMPLQKMYGYSFTCHIWRFLWTNPCMDPCVYMSLGLIRANMGKRQNPKKQRTWTQWRLWRTGLDCPRHNQERTGGQEAPGK